jgi:hypothetical protein
MIPAYDPATKHSKIVYFMYPVGLADIVSRRFFLYYNIYFYISQPLRQKIYSPCIKSFIILHGSVEYVVLSVEC